MAKRAGAAKKIANQIRGLKAQSAGKAFESAFETICAQNNFTCIRIPNSCRTISRAPWLVRIKSPFDYVIVHQGFSVFLDLKSTISQSFSYSNCDQDQIKTLFMARKDAVSGYLVHYTSINKIVFYDAKVLAPLAPRSSLGHYEGIQLGTFGYQCDLHKLKAVQI